VGNQCILRDYFLTDGSHIPWGTGNLPAYNPVTQGPCDVLPENIVVCDYESEQSNVLQLTFNSDFAVVQLNISSILANIDTLVVLEYIQANLTGSIPIEFGSMSWLEVFIIKETVGNFNSTFGDEFRGMSSLRWVDFGAGGFYGNLSNSALMFQDIGFLNPPNGLYSYNFSHNHFYGQIPESAIGSNVYSLDLSHNMISGTIPEATRTPFCRAMVSPMEAPDDEFGYSVATSLTLVASASPQANNSAGEVYIYDCSNMISCDYITTLSDPDGAANDEFGYSISFSNSTLIVGSINKNSMGAFFAYYCMQSGCTEFPGNPYTPVGLTLGSSFGASVSISSGFVAVGAPTQRGIGDVYVYNCLDMDCVEASYNPLIEPQTVDYGASVSVSGAVFVVTAVNHTSGRPIFYTYNCNFTHCSNFSLNPHTISGEASNNIADTVASSDYLVVVGSYSQGVNSTGWINSYTCQDGVCTPSPTNPVLSPNPSYNGEFGAWIRCLGNMVLVGAPGENNGTGRAYLYIYNNTANTLEYSNTFSVQGGLPGDAFGFSGDILIGQTTNYVVVSSPFSHERQGGEFYLINQQYTNYNSCIPTYTPPAPIRRSFLETKSIFPLEYTLADKVYDLSYNSLTGTVPASFLGLAQNDLTYMILSHNNLTGPLDFSQITSTIDVAPTISVLTLDNNPNFGGTLPTQLALMRNLRIIDMSKCGLSGPVNMTAVIGTMLGLQFFGASNNSFNGTVQAIVDDVNYMFHYSILINLQGFYIFENTGFTCPYPYRISLWDTFGIATDYPAAGDYTFMCVDCEDPLICPIGAYCLSTSSDNSTIQYGAYNCTPCPVAGEAGYLCNFTMRDLAVYTTQLESSCYSSSCPGWSTNATLMHSCQNPLFGSQCAENGGQWAPGFTFEVTDVDVAFQINAAFEVFVNDIAVIHISGVHGVMGIDPAIYFMENLTTIYIDAALHGTLPTEMGMLQKLSSIIINYGSYLTGTIPTEIASLPYLDLFSLVNTPSMNGTIPTQFFSSQSLRTFYLASSAIGGNLLFIDSLSSEQMADSIIYSIGIVDTQVGGPLPQNIHFYPHLAFFQTQFNHFTGSIPVNYAKRTIFYETLFQNHLTGVNNYYVQSLIDYLTATPDPTIAPPAPPPRTPNSRRREADDLVNDIKKRISMSKRSPQLQFGFLSGNNFTCANLTLNTTSATLLYGYTDFMRGPSPNQQYCGMCPTNPTLCTGPGQFCQSFTAESTSSPKHTCVTHMDCPFGTCGTICNIYGNIDVCPLQPPSCG